MTSPMFDEPAVADVATKKPRKKLPGFLGDLNPKKLPSLYESPQGKNKPVKDPKAYIQPIAPEKTKPSISPLDMYLANDSTYQQSLRGNKRNLADFLSELSRRRGEAGTQFNKTQASMNRDAADQLDSLREEYASRGLIHSGLYGKAQGDFRTKFEEQLSSLQDQQTGLLSDLLTQEKNYNREIDLANENAKQAALLRRASAYKVGGK